MDGNCYDNTQDVPHLEAQEKKGQPDPNKKLIDAIIDCISECVNLKDDTVNLQIIRTLLTIATSPICTVNNYSYSTYLLILNINYYIKIQEKYCNLSKSLITYCDFVVIQYLLNYINKEQIYYGYLINNPLLKKKHVERIIILYKIGNWNQFRKNYENSHHNSLQQQYFCQIQQIQIYYLNLIASKQPQIIDPSKHAFTQIIVETFKKMEKNTLLSQEETLIYQNKKQIGMIYNPVNKIQSTSILSNTNLMQDQSSLVLNSFSQISQNMYIQQPGIIQQDLSIVNNELMNQLVIQMDEEQQKQLLSYYVNKVVVNLVDDVCIYEDKVKKVQRKHLNQETNSEQIKAELDLIPIKSVPNFNDIDTPQYKKSTVSSIQNEKDIAAGKFGWQYNFLNYQQYTSYYNCNKYLQLQSCFKNILINICKINAFIDNQESF